MREHIKAFLVASSIGIPTFVDAEALDPGPGRKRGDARIALAARASAHR
jgi:hypothetical protein